MANYFFNHARGAENIDKWFIDHGFSRIKDTAEINYNVHLKTGDLVFVHDRDYLFWIDGALTNQKTDFVFMSRKAELRKDEKWPANIYICRYPADALDKYDRVKCFFQGLSSGKRLWNCLSTDTKTNLIALSILCQGYLAAHGKQSFEVFDNKLQQKAVKNKDETEYRNWWKHVLKKEKGIDEELEAISKKNEVMLLINIIKNEVHENISYFNGKTLIQGKEADFTDKVNEASKNLSEILEENF